MIISHSSFNEIVICISEKVSCHDRFVLKGPTCCSQAAVKSKKQPKLKFLHGISIVRFEWESALLLYQLWSTLPLHVFIGWPCFLNHSVCRDPWLKNMDSYKGKSWICVNDNVQSSISFHKKEKYTVIPFNIASTVTSHASDSSHDPWSSSLLWLPPDSSITLAWHTHSSFSPVPAPHVFHAF